MPTEVAGCNRHRRRELVIIGGERRGGGEREREICVHTTSSIVRGEIVVPIMRYIASPTERQVSRGSEPPYVAPQKKIYCTRYRGRNGDSVVVVVEVVADAAKGAEERS